MSNLINVIRSRYQGQCSENSWQRFDITYDQYQTFQVEIKKIAAADNWAFEKVRHDYNPVKGLLFLRMASPCHDILAHDLEGLIFKKLERLRRRKNLKSVINRTKQFSTSSHQCRQDPRGRWSPDAGFGFLGVDYPCFILEVANSQKSQDLPYLADDHFVSTKGNLKTVLTVDIEYLDLTQRRAGKEIRRTAVYSVYRYRRTYDDGIGRFIRELHLDIENIPFRAQDGSPIIGELKLNLSDFCPNEVLTGIRDPTIKISHEALTKLLDDAEMWERNLEPSSGPSTSEHDDFIRTRTRPPTLEIVPEDEEGWLNEENAVIDQCSQEDSSYSPPRRRPTRRPTRRQTGRGRT